MEEPAQACAALKDNINGCAIKRSVISDNRNIEPRQFTVRTALVPAVVLNSAAHAITLQPAA